MRTPILCIAFLCIAISLQAQTTTAYMYGDLAGNFCGTGTTGTFRTLGTSSWRFIQQASTAGDKFYKVYNQADNIDCNFNNPPGSKVWSGDLSINTLGTIFAYGDGNGSAGKYTTSAGKFYTFSWKDVSTTSNSEGLVMETSFNPVTFNLAAQLPANGSVTDIDTVFVFATLSANTSPEELMYVRYSTDNFATYGTLVPGQISGASVTFKIPPLPGNTMVSYYMFSTTLSQASLSGNANLTDLATINFKRNGAVNYNYTVSSTLPVRFTGFTGQLLNGKSQLKWNVSEESGIQYYWVEKSEDGINFRNIATIAARNNIQPGSYSYIDPVSLNARSYYRITAVETGGRLYKTGIVTVVPSSGVISLYPNPATNTIFVQFDKASSTRQLRIVSVSGQLIKTLGAATNNCLVPVAHLPAGLYFLEIVDQSGTETLKWWKQ